MKKQIILLLLVLVLLIAAVAVIGQAEEALPAGGAYMKSGTARGAVLTVSNAGYKDSPVASATGLSLYP